LDVEKLSKATGNIYKSVSIIGQRANQYTVETKRELEDKLKDFQPTHDNLEEVMENREQIEISRFYEKKSKASRESVEGFLDGKVYWRDANDPADTNAPELNS